MSITSMPSGQEPTLPGPESITDTKLPNSMRALVRESHTSPTVVVQGLLCGGALHDPPHLSGLAGITAAMLERGTETQTFAQLSEELESVGAEIDFSAGRYTIAFDARCMAEDLPRVVRRLSQMLQEPTFPPDQLERLRGQVLTALEQRENNPRRRAARAFREMAYGPDHPFARETDGSHESISAITRDDIAAFYRRVVRPAGGILAVVGDVEADRLVDALSATLGAWSPAGSAAPQPEVPPPPPIDERLVKRVDMPGKSQSDLVLGSASIPRTHQDWIPASLANIVLGVFGLMGRLGENVRDRLGLAYYAYSRLTGGLGPGPWYAAAGVNPANVDAAVEAIDHEIRRLRSQPISDDELDDVRAYVTGSLPLQLETNAGVARALLDMAFYDLGMDYLQRFSGLVEAVRPEDLLNAARNHLNADRGAVAVAGPPTT